MKIVVKSVDEEDRFRISVWIPLVFLKSRMLWRLMSRDKDVDLLGMRETVDCIYSGLRRFVKRNGHFYLACVQSSDGTRVSIKI